MPHCLSRCLSRFSFAPRRDPLRVMRLAALAAIVACGGDGDDAQSPPVDEGSPVTPGCQEGTVATTSALYQVCFPANWNGDLIVYGHGYVIADEPLKVPDDE